MLAMFDIKNIYVFPDQRGQTAIVGHFDFSAPPGKELLINDSAIIWAEGFLKVRAESPPTTPTKHLTLLSTQQYLLH